MHGAGPDHHATIADGMRGAAAARLGRQLDFLVAVDRLKGVVRRTSLCDGSRLENSAEHSWHLALAALVLAEHADPGVDVLHAVRMLLVHDLVEIDAGDTFAFDAAANEGRAERERVAAERIFGMLPAEQGGELRRLWEEFEAGETAAARFAVALDRLQPLLANDRAGGGSWSRYDVARDQVMRRMAPIEGALPAVWPAVLDVVERHCTLGHIRTDGTP